MRISTVLLALAIGLGSPTPGRSGPPGTPRPTVLELDATEKCSLLAHARASLAAALEDEDPPSIGSASERVAATSMRVRCTLRRDGEVLGSGEGNATHGFRAVNGAVSEAAKRLKRGLASAVRIELSISDIPDPPARLTYNELKQQVDLGVHGIWMEVGDERAYAPSDQAIAGGHLLSEVLADLAGELNLDGDEWRHVGARFAIAPELHLVEPQHLSSPCSELRHGVLAGQADTDREALLGAASRAGAWLAKNQLKDGFYAPLYDPHAARFGESDDLMLQAGAAFAMATSASYLGMESFNQSARRCIDRVLREAKRAKGKERIRYIPQEGFGELGSTALTLLAMLRLEGASNYDDWIQDFGRSIVSLQEPDGRLRASFSHPDDFDEALYSGDGLLALSLLHRRNGREQLKDAVRRSFEYYRTYWRAEHDPVMVPGHTQAAYHMYAATGDREYADFAFEMTDWLLGKLASTKESSKDPDHVGGIGGPPPAADTAAYLESVALACELAQQIGDAARAARYRAAAFGAAGFVLRLQVKEDELFYLPAANRPAAIGAFRSSLTDHSLRIDAARHAMLGLIHTDMLPLSVP